MFLYVSSRLFMFHYVFVILLTFSYLEQLREQADGAHGVGAELSPRRGKLWKDVIKAVTFMGVSVYNPDVSSSLLKLVPCVRWAVCPSPLRGHAVSSLSPGASFPRSGLPVNAENVSPSGHVSGASRFCRCWFLASLLRRPLSSGSQGFRILSGVPFCGLCAAPVPCSGS